MDVQPTSGEGALGCGVAPGVTKGLEMISEALLRVSSRGKRRRGLVSMLRKVNIMDGFV